MRLKLLVLLTLLLLLPTLTLAEIMTVSFSGTEMRSASKVVTKVATFIPLEVLEKGAEYYKVEDYRGRTGWVHRSLLSSKPGIVVTGDLANVRRGPGTNHPVIFQLSKGDSCRLLSKQEKWLEVQSADGRKGWVADFLTWGR